MHSFTSWRFNSLLDNTSFTPSIQPIRSHPLHLGPCISNSYTFLANQSSFILSTYPNHLKIIWSIRSLTLAFYLTFLPSHLISDSTVWILLIPKIFLKYFISTAFICFLPCPTNLLTSHPCNRLSPTVPSYIPTFAYLMTHLYLLNFCNPPDTFFASPILWFTSSIIFHYF